MRHIKILLLAVLVLSGLSACKDDEPSSVSHIVITLDADGVEVPDGTKVSVVNTVNNVIYTIETEDGICELDVENGNYNISASFQQICDYEPFMFNGLNVDFLVTGNASIVVDMVKTRSNNLIFKEIYYTGCKGADGKNYMYDQYFVIVNNSDVVSYLDGVCIAFAAMTRASSQCPWGDFDKYDYCAAYRFIWSFPGTGFDNPIQPGEEVVIAANAINHIELGNSESVDLSREGVWAAYADNAGLTKQTPPTTPDKKMLNMLWKTSSMTIWSCSCMDPAVVLFKPRTSMDEYVRDYITNNPANASDSYEYMKIPYEWVYDGVEVFDADNRNKRLAPSVDAGYVLNASSIGSGTSVCRKVDDALTTTSGSTRYVDTNNSSNDFVVLSSPLLKK
ncbi:MAG: DUF4876 domain-containing protein [Marinilabiliaceae bacterium]|nr:DUF4876 domain-containing protein [Marinilabiliaceae bacterium]